jgi:hypothetical protein
MAGNTTSDWVKVVLTGLGKTFVQALLRLLGIGLQ